MIFVVYFMKMVRSLMTFVFDRKDELNMTVKEFVEGYTQLGSEKLKEKYIKEHIINNYIPFKEKVTVGNLIAEIGYKGKDGSFAYNSNTHYMLYCLELIKLYTDIELSQSNEEADILDEFDCLSKNDMFSVILNAIPEKEINELTSIINRSKNDYIANSIDINLMISKKSDLIAEQVLNLLNNIPNEVNE